jgi:hypothetical protein
MPCNSDYMNPTASEQRAQRAAELLMLLFDKGQVLLNKKQAELFEGLANNCYATHEGQTELLCNAIKNMRSSGRFKTFLAENVMDRQARQLANWAEEHDEADRRREESERYQVRSTKEAELLDQFKKLSDEQLENVLQIFQQASK